MEEVIVSCSFSAKSPFQVVGWNEGGKSVLSPPATTLSPAFRSYGRSAKVLKHLERLGIIRLRGCILGNRYEASYHLRAAPSDVVGLYGRRARGVRSRQRG